MRKRALLIGSQTGGLTGVHGDVEVMADALGALGFEVRRHIEAAAASAAIVDAYHALVTDSGAQDAAVVYYSGHGGRKPNEQRGTDPSAPPHLQWIVPTDIDDRRGDGFNGILAEELSALQWQLTERTRNVTTILDCCHSARMFRDTDIVPKADRRTFPWDDIAARWARVRAAGQVGVGDVNPHAVQLVACEPDQSAYELSSSSIGGAHGALTAELVAVLRRPDVGRLSWREVIEIIRPAVLDVVPVQRPDLLGERSARDRILFSTELQDHSGVLGVGRDGTTAWLERPALFGVAAGDRYRLVAPGTDARHSTWIADVERVDGDRALLTLRGVAASELPAGVLAHPLETALGRRPVAVRPADHPDRERVVAALRTSPHVLVRDGGEIMATVELDDDGARILDVAGEPLQAAAQTVTSATLATIDDALRRLARATHLRELESGSGAAALPDDVALQHRRLVDGREVEVAAGEHVYDGDRLVVRATNRSAETRYVTVLDVGLTGGVTILTAAQPSGTTMAAGQEVVVGENAAHAIEGVELYWPDDLPRGGPRPESLITIVADAPIDGLPALAQSGVATRSATRGERSAIDLLLEDVAVGTRDVRLPAPAAEQTRYRVHRLDLLVHPTPRPPADDEPTFEIDDRPDASFRLVPPRAATPPPGRVAVRVSDLVVHSDRSFLERQVRVDVLVVTAAGGGAPPF
ncbi:MAG TPA: caspase family protein, partial [Ilumatobacteraceae bacterium]|nr:caspase family protein [Ilumatobacteraceae bacterium]